MALPQGIDFSATAGYVTHGANTYAQVAPGTGGNYPTTTPQGQTVGWEGTAFGQIDSRDRSTTIDPRLAGSNFTTTAAVAKYRIDLPTSGAQGIRLAAGDASFTSNVLVELLDDTTSLGVLANATSLAGGQFKDAANVTLSAANWPGSNTLVTKTFASTIARFAIGGTVGSNRFINHIYIESAGAAPLTGAPGTQANTAGTGALTQTHLLAGAAGVQGNMAGTGAVSETQVLAGAPGSQPNAAGTGAVGQTHVLAGAAAVQANDGSAGAIALGGLAAAPGAQQNVAGSGAIVQTHVLGASNAVQTNSGPGGAIQIVADPRYARAVSDVAAGPWQPSTGTSLAAVIDEPSADATDYIVASSAGSCEIALNPVADPGTSSGQVVRYQAWSETGNGLTVRLMQGATEVGAWTHAALPFDPTIFAQSLTPAQCDSITNYADLRFTFEAF